MPMDEGFAQDAEGLGLQTGPEMSDADRIRMLTARVGMLEEHFAKIVTVVGRLEMEVQELRAERQRG